MANNKVYRVQNKDTKFRIPYVFRFRIDAMRQATVLGEEWEVVCVH